MGEKAKSALKERMAQSDCCHYWVIESPRGATSRGMCKFCGAKKEFQNYLPGLSWEGDQSFIFESSGAQDTEPDAKEDNP